MKRIRCAASVAASFGQGMLSNDEVMHNQGVEVACEMIAFKDKLSLVILLN